MDNTNIIAARTLNELARYCYSINMEPDADVVGEMIGAQVRIILCPHRSGWLRGYAKAAVAFHRASGVTVSERLQNAALSVAGKRAVA